MFEQTPHSDPTLRKEADEELQLPLPEVTNDQSALLRVLEDVARGEPTLLSDREILGKAIEHGYVERLDEEEVLTAYSALQDEIFDCGESLKRIASLEKECEESVPEANSMPEANQETLPNTESIAQDYAEKDRAYQELVRESRDPVARFFRVCTKYLRQVPVVSSLVPKVTFEERLQLAQEARIETLRVSQEAQRRLLEGKIQKKELDANRDRLVQERREVEARLDAAQRQLEGLKDLKENLAGWCRIKPSGEFARLCLKQPNVDLNRPADDLFKRISDFQHGIRNQIDDAGAFRKKLIEQLSWPEAGAELVSWYLVNRDGRVDGVIESFRRTHETVCRFVAPSYTQLLLTLQVLAHEKPAFEALSAISRMSHNLPNFETAERYLVADLKQDVRGDAEADKQQKLMEFVDLLTGPLGEHLSGFERYLVAAKLGTYKESFEEVADKYVYSFKAMLERGYEASYKTSLTAALLIQSPQRGEKRFEPFDQVCTFLDQVEPELSKRLALESAFFSLLPGDPLFYAQCLALARLQLMNKDYPEGHATALALPAALDAIKALWKHELEHEAITLADKVSEIDEQLTMEEYQDAREEIRRVRLEEELLASLTALHDLYSEVEDLNLGTMWRKMAESASAQTTIEIDKARAELAAAKKKAKAEQTANPTLTDAEILDQLLEAEEELLRQIREAELGREDR